MKNLLLHLVLLLFVLNLFQEQDANAQAGMWTWMKGQKQANQAGQFGVQGIPSATNNPPSIYEGCQWTDLNGNFWLLGGWSAIGEISDLWKYDLSTNEWTWMKGSGIPGDTGNYGIQGIPSSFNNPPACIWGQATWTDLQGNLWLFGGDHNGSLGALWKFDISSNQWTWMKGSKLPMYSGHYGIKGVPDTLNNPAAREECAATWVDTNGDLWMFGGYHYSSVQDGFLNDLWRYNISFNEWTWIKGDSTLNQPGFYGIKGVENVANIPTSRLVYNHWIDSLGNFWLFGGESLTQNHNDVWRFNPKTNNWVWMNGDTIGNSFGTYTSKCILSTYNQPCSRFENRACWTDLNGDFWTFGGSSAFYSSDSSRNDLWKYCWKSNKWIWVNGDSIHNPSGDWGIKGIPSLTNKPNGRYGSVSWTDQVGNFYLFGGASNAGGKFFNDLWRYSPDSNCSPCSLIVTKPIINLFSSDTNFCEKNCINFFDLSTNNPSSWQWHFPGASPDTSTLQNPTGICYNTYGNYDVTLIACNGNGCDSLHLTNFITCYQNPVDSIYQSNDTLYSMPAFSYQWYETTIGVIAGATNQFYVLSQPGSYFCVVRDSVGCESTSNVVVITAVPPLSFGEGPGVRLHPNPNDGSFEIVLNNEQETRNVELRILNAVGQVVFTSPLTTHHSQIKTQLPNGIYSVSITTNNGVITKRIEVIH